MLAKTDAVSNETLNFATGGTSRELTAIVADRFYRPCEIIGANIGRPRCVELGCASGRNRPQTGAILLGYQEVAKTLRVLTFARS